MKKKPKKEGRAACTEKYEKEDNGGAGAEN